MTGFGEARHAQDALFVAVEFRTVNNKYFKLNLKCPDKYSSWEPRIEKLVRESINRGTVTLAIKVKRDSQSSQYQLQEQVLRSYWNDLERIMNDLGVKSPRDFSSLLLLPGVVAENDGDQTSHDVEQDWPLFEKCLREALLKLREFHQQEGQSMADDMRKNAQVIRTHLEQIAVNAKEVVQEFRRKLHDRIDVMLQGSTVALSEADIIREVAIYADRCDVSEEITRLRCHLDQLEQFIQDQNSQGRKLEFLCQEFFREVNTIGSKSTHVGIAHHVVEIKSAVERMKEMVMNIE
jgi:uncharacterized protein (TIGR00255 family)